MWANVSIYELQLFKNAIIFSQQTTTNIPCKHLIPMKVISSHDLQKIQQNYKHHQRENNHSLMREINQKVQGNILPKGDLANIKY